MNQRELDLRLVTRNTARRSEGAAIICAMLVWLGLIGVLAAVELVL